MKITKLCLPILSIGFLCQLNAQPSFIWGKQFGTKNGESGQGIVFYKSGDIVLAGKAKGNLFSDNLGQTDGFIMKMDSCIFPVNSIL